MQEQEAQFKGVREALNAGLGEGVGEKEKAFIYQVFLSSIHLPIQALPIYSPVSSLIFHESRTNCRQWLAVWMDNRCNMKQDTTKSVLKHLAVKEHMVVMRPAPLKAEKRLKVK